jgi:hypothetical protein
MPLVRERTPQLAARLRAALITTSQEGTHTRAEAMRQRQSRQRTLRSEAAMPTRAATAARR